MNVGEPVVLKQAPDPDDKLALAKIAFEVAVEANKVTPITFPALISMVLLGVAPRALTEDEVARELERLVAWAQERNIFLSDDLQKDIATNLDGVLGLMISEKIITRYDAGPETVYGIDQQQHPIASYYRNSIIHFFLNQAIIELSAVKIRDLTGAQALEQFWIEVDKIRDHFKFEFFYSPTELFHQEIEAELNRHCPEALEQLDREEIYGEHIMRSIQPLVAHQTLLTFAEAYSVVADVASDPKSLELESKMLTEACLKLGRQAYLQRRISSESSIAKLLFQNGFDLLRHRGLDQYHGEETREQRRAMALEFRDILRRIEAIKAMALTRTLQ
jgi:glycerol-3-phosphate O-acyltransferase